MSSNVGVGDPTVSVSRRHWVGQLLHLLVTAAVLVWALVAAFGDENASLTTRILAAYGAVHGITMVGRMLLHASEQLRHHVEEVHSLVGLWAKDLRAWWHLGSRED
jgi:hypothetical protein